MTSSPGPPRGTVFDLASLRDVDRKWNQRFLCLMLVGVVGLSLEVTFAAVSRFRSLATGGLATAGGQVLVFVLVMTMIAVTYAALSLPVNFSGAVAVRVEPRAIGITYPNRKERILAFDDPRCRFQLRDQSSSARMLAQRRGYYLFVPYVPGDWNLNRRSVLTAEAFEAILHAVQKAGIRITSYQGSQWLFGAFPPLIHRVQGSLSL